MNILHVFIQFFVLQVSAFLVSLFAFFSRQFVALIFPYYRLNKLLSLGFDLGQWCGLTLVNYFGFGFLRNMYIINAKSSLFPFQHRIRYRGIQAHVSAVI